MSHQYREEGLRLALEMERRGIGLYTRAALLTDDPEIISIVRDLANDERQHHATFLAMLNAQGGNHLSDEENALLSAKAADVFFPGGLMQIALDGALSSPLSMIACALEAERSSIAFYKQLREHLPQSDHDAIDMIIEEEEGHIRALSGKEEKEMEKEKVV